MSLTFLTGIAGGIILVLGSAWPDAPVKKATDSKRNWLLSIGAIFTFTYSILNYMDGTGVIFFIFLQSLAIFASILLMTNVPENKATPLITAGGIAAVIAALYYFEDKTTLYIILGIVGIAVGYVLEEGTRRRNLALFLGSLLIAYFSYLVNDPIFLWLNVAFAGFSGYYTLKTT
jgi:hypothetical protein